MRRLSTFVPPWFEITLALQLGLFHRSCIGAGARNCRGALGVPVISVARPRYKDDWKRFSRQMCSEGLSTIPFPDLAHPRFFQIGIDLSEILFNACVGMLKKFLGLGPTRFHRFASGLSALFRSRVLHISFSAAPAKCNCRRILRHITKYVAHIRSAPQSAVYIIRSAP